MALGALAIALCGVSISASATSTASWSQADRSAATIREFQTRLMVAALRCRAAGINVLASYNQFIAADRAELTAANDRLKLHFKSADPVRGDRDYDRYTTSLANGSAGEQWSPASCDAAARLARQAAGSKGNLLAVATGDSEVADNAAASWAAPAAYRYAERTPPPGYDNPPPSPRERDAWRSDEAYNDRAPPPGYDDRARSWRERDDPRPQQADQAYNDQLPPPGYYDQGPPPGYDDRGPPPGYEDRGAPRDYAGY